MSRMLTVIDDERGKLEIEFDLGMAMLHLIIRLPLAGMRAAHELFPQVKSWLKSVGHDQVFVIIKEGDEKLYRFQRLFGFQELARKNGNILMEQRC